MNFCKKCVYPHSTVNLMVDDDGVCSSCKSFEAFGNISDDIWKKEKEKLIDNLEPYLKKINQIMTV